MVPEANQAFRILVARELGGQLEPGPHELPLQELSKRIEAMEPFNPATASLRFTYHVRYSISIAPLVLSLLALAVSVVTRRRAIAVAWGVVGAVSYVAAFFVTDAGVQTAPLLRIIAAWLPDAVFSVMEATQPAVWLPIAAAWLPNAAFIFLAAILLRSGPPTFISGLDSPQVAESRCRYAGSNKPISVERDSFGKEQLLEPLALLE